MNNQSNMEVMIVNKSGSDIYYFYVDNLKYAIDTYLQQPLSFSDIKQHFANGYSPVLLSSQSQLYIDHNPNENMTFVGWTTLPEDNSTSSGDVLISIPAANSGAESWSVTGSHSVPCSYTPKLLVNSYMNTATNTLTIVISDMPSVTIQNRSGGNITVGHVHCNTTNTPQQFTQTSFAAADAPPLTTVTSGSHIKVYVVATQNNSNNAGISTNLTNNNNNNNNTPKYTQVYIWPPNASVSDVASSSVIFDYIMPTANQTNNGVTINKPQVQQVGSIVNNGNYALIGRPDIGYTYVNKNTANQGNQFTNNPNLNNQLLNNPNLGANIGAGNNTLSQIGQNANQLNPLAFNDGIIVAPPGTINNPNNINTPNGQFNGGQWPNNSNNNPNNNPNVNQQTLSSGWWLLLGVVVLVVLGLLIWASVYMYNKYKKPAQPQYVYVQELPPGTIVTAPAVVAPAVGAVQQTPVPMSSIPQSQIPMSQSITDLSSGINKGFNAVTASMGY